jgi:hypothetical protein
MIPDRKATRCSIQLQISSCDEAPIVSQSSGVLNTNSQNRLVEGSKAQLIPLPGDKGQGDYVPSCKCHTSEYANLLTWVSNKQLPGFTAPLTKSSFITGCVTPGLRAATGRLDGYSMPHTLVKPLPLLKIWTIVHPPREIARFV